MYAESWNDDDEMPEHKDRVRVNLQKFGVIMKPFFDQTQNKEFTENFFLS